MDGLSAALTVFAGWLIGATGIGGVLIVPLLQGLEGVALQRAIAASSLAFALPGAAALLRLQWHRRQALIEAAPADSALPVMALVLGAVPGALAGALLVHQAPASVLMAGLALLALGSGWRGLRRPSLAAASAPILSWWLAVGLGALVGLGSGLTGTGGPVLLLPLLMAWRQPLAGSVAAAQAIQLPVALSAGLTHLGTGGLDVALAMSLAGWLLLGSLLGQWSASRMVLGQLQRLVSVLLLSTGAWFAWRVFSF